MPYLKNCGQIGVGDANSTPSLKVKFRYQQYCVTIECSGRPQTKMVFEWLRGVAIDIQREGDKSLKYHITTDEFSGLDDRHILEKNAEAAK